MKRSHALVITFLVSALAAAGCGWLRRFRPGTARVLFSRTIGNDTGLFLVTPGEGAPERVLANAPPMTAAFAIDGGHALMASFGTGVHAEVWRVDVGRPFVRTRLIVPSGAVLLLGASEDGRTLLVSQPVATDVSSVAVVRVDAGAQLQPLSNWRYVYNVALSEDGTRGMVAGYPAGCTNLHSCSIELWGYDFAHANAAHPIATGARAYQPRFVPGSSGRRITYQSTEFDSSPECLADLNHCRHDILARDFDAHEAPTVLMRAAIQWTYSPSGEHVGYLSYDDPATHCASLPCTTSTLLVRRAGGGDARVVISGQVSSFGPRFWSPDDRWVGASTQPEPTAHRHITIVRTDGSARYDLGEGSMLAWVRQR